MCGAKTPLSISHPPRPFFHLLAPLPTRTRLTRLPFVPRALLAPSPPPTAPSPPSLNITGKNSSSIRSAAMLLEVHIENQEELKRVETRNQTLKNSMNAVQKEEAEGLRVEFKISEQVHEDKTVFRCVCV